MSASKKVLTNTVFQSSKRTFFMGKWGAWPLQNLVTIPNSMMANGSLLYRGDPRSDSKVSGPHQQQDPPKAPQSQLPGEALTEDLWDPT